MDVSRNFLLIGVAYLVIGIGFGGYMGASGNTLMTPIHAHLNLLGFTVMTIFGLVYRVLPAMAVNTLAKVHFWLHQIGVLVLMVGLFLYLSGLIPETALAPIAPPAELAILIGVLVFGWNLFKNGK